MTDYDSPWKETLEHYFPDFIAFFFPNAHADIDWERGYTFLDKELEKVVRDAELGKRFVDKLVQVWRQEGEKEFILIHIEVQGNQDSNFAKRMYVYNYRIFDRYKQKVASLAVLADGNRDWRPTEYSYELWGSRSGIQFPVVKLLDYGEKWADLESNRNPFAAVVMAHLKAVETAKDQESRYRWKLELIRHLYEQGRNRQEILELFRFIDWVLELPAEQEEQLWQEVKKFEERQKMQYVTSVERIGMQKGMEEGMEKGIEKGMQKGMEKGMQKGMEKGIEKGMQKGEITLLKRQLKLRFGDLPDWVENRLTQATTDQLERWAEKILDAITLEEVFEE